MAVENRGVAPETKKPFTRRFKRLLGGFGVLSAAQATGTVAQELYDKNPITAQTTSMSLFDGALAGALLFAARCESKGYWKAGSVVRFIACGGHIGVAAYGTHEAFDRQDMAYDPRSFLVSAGLGGAALALALRDRHKTNSGEHGEPDINEQMAINLVHTKVGEGAALVGSTLAATITGDPHWLVFGAAATTAGVAIPMARQMASEIAYTANAQKT